MAYLDFNSEPGVFALGGGLLDVDVRSPAAAARGLLPGVTPSSNELVGGFPSTYTSFTNATFSPLTAGGGGLNTSAGNPGGTLYDIGDPLIHAANHFDSARDMALMQAQHQMQLQQQQQQQQFPTPVLNPTASMAQASNYPHGMLSQASSHWRHVGHVNPPDGLRCTPSPAPSSVNSLPGSNASSLAPERTCLVCSDEALGRHFGVLTCEACKSFFRRSVRTSAQYFCRYNRNCHVVKQSRNKCQYCRYQKCVRVGMQPDAVQEERAAATGKPVVTKEDDSPVSPSPSSTHQAASSMVVASPASSWGIAAAVPADTKNITTLLSSNPPESSSKQLSLPALLDAERAWDGDQLTKEPITTPADFNDIVSATKDQLNYAIEWAKRVPPFTTLSLDDQVVVLKSVWNELLTLQLAFRASPFENTLILGSGQLLYRDQGNPDICRLVGRFIDEIVTPCRTMGLEMAELVAMKSIVLFNPDCPKLVHPGQVENLQEQCMEILSEYCHARFPEQKLRFSKILLRLSAVRSITTETRDFIIQHHQHSNIQVDSFVLEMLGVEKAD